MGVFWNFPYYISHTNTKQTSFINKQDCISISISFGNSVSWNFSNQMDRLLPRDSFPFHLFSSRSDSTFVFALFNCLLIRPSLLLTNCYQLLRASKYKSIHNYEITSRKCGELNIQPLIYPECFKVQFRIIT